MYYETVSALCKAHDISIYDLEKKADIGNGTIGRWKDSDVQPNLRTLKKIAEIFDMPLEALLTYKPGA